MCARIKCNYDFHKFSIVLLMSESGNKFSSGAFSEVLLHISHGMTFENQINLTIVVVSQSF